jgi:hypothetical protein
MPVLPAIYILALERKAERKQALSRKLQTEQVYTFSKINRLHEQTGQTYEEWQELYVATHLFCCHIKRL